MSAVALRLRLLARPARLAPAARTRALSTTPTPRADPFPLPLSREMIEANKLRNPQDVVEEWGMPTPLDRTGESDEALRARLIYQTRKRGVLEADLLLSTFARDNLPGMSVVQMKEFDKFLDEPDWDIYYWCVDKRPVPERWAKTELMAKCVPTPRSADPRLKKHARNDEKVSRRMPEMTEVLK
ncbi:Succinate dehydrogenase assembly factor 2 mitochondrial [Vanrija albida]|uniref:Succinate dehydrogenase assembly factor 2, mitochondrial n=1 Tax=Vanrija albida TaxID=181172 RepID=A0ABR3QGM6_9TREE